MTDPRPIAEHGPDAEARTSELTPSWMTSVLIVWGDDGNPAIVVGVDAGPLPLGDDGAEVSVLHVVTSQDPLGVAQSPERNHALLGDLLRWAEGQRHAHGWRWWPVTGADTFSGHAEQGIGIAGMDRAAAAVAGERWEQLAIYELTPELVRVVPTHGGPAAGTVTAEGPRRWSSTPAGARSPDEETVDAWWRTYGTAAARHEVSLPSAAAPLSRPMQEDLAWRDADVEGTL
jgi:hypothetical protein